MTDTQIDLLIKLRSKLTDRRDEQYDYDAISAIDAQLAEECEPGQRNDVDLLLGRMCAVLGKYAPKVGWFQNPAMTLEDESTQALIEKTRRIWEAAQPIEY